MKDHIITSLFRFGENLYRSWYRFSLEHSSGVIISIRKSAIDENTLIVIRPALCDCKTYECDFNEPFWYHNVCDAFGIEPYKPEWAIANCTMTDLSRIMNDEESPHKEEAAAIYEEIKSVVEGTNEKWS